jgi:hypothetical protein
MSDLPYHELPPPPASVSGVTVLCRLADGLAFRYRWATEDLRPADLAFTPCAGAMSLGKLLAHMRILVEWVDGTLRGALAHEPADIDDPAPPRGDELEELRQGTLATIVSLRAALLELGDERLAGVTITGAPHKGPQPFWSLLNGPLADFLTHVGQVNSWRRMAGNPPLRADVFRGRAPL